MGADATAYDAPPPGDQQGRRRGISLRKESVVARAVNQARNAKQKAKGKAKEVAGAATGKRKLEAKGKADQAKAGVKKTAERANHSR